MRGIIRKNFSNFLAPTLLPLYKQVTPSLISPLSVAGLELVSIVYLKTCLKFTTTMLARTAFGKTEKYFPSASSNMVSIMQEMIDVI